MLSLFPFFYKYVFLEIWLIKQYNVNRVSLGVQTFNKSNLTELNRNHTKEEVYKVVEDLKKALGV